MSVLEQIKKLEEQKAKLLSDAKAEAMAKVEQGLRDLAELGYTYRLVSDDSFTPPARTTKPRGRRGNVRDTVLATIKDTPGGINRADLLVKLEAKGDKAAEQSISNALANLKKAGTITATDGTYTVAG